MATIISYRPNKLSFPRQVYSDANFLISFYVTNHQWHRRASILLAELTIQKVEIHLSLLTIDEALFQLLILTYEDQNGAGSWQGNETLKRDPNICARLQPELDSFVKRLWKLPYIRLIDGPSPAFDIVDDSLRNIASYSLAPRDAFHLAILKAAGLSMILTNDSDFDRVHDLPIYVLHFR
jgi:predicted nucleic acid-binding protein